MKKPFLIPSKSRMLSELKKKFPEGVMKVVEKQGLSSLAAIFYSAFSNEERKEIEKRWADKKVSARPCIIVCKDIPNAYSEWSALK